MVTSEAGPFRKPQPARQPENGERQQGHIHARDHQQVINAGLLEFFADVAQEQRIVAHDHGGKKRCVFVVPQTLLANMLAGCYGASGCARSPAGCRMYPEELQCLPLSLKPAR